MTEGSGHTEKEKTGCPLFSLAMLATGLIIAGVLAILAVNSAPAPTFKAAGPKGTIQAVTLVTGQVYFGTLRSEDHGVFVLTDVFEVQTNTNPQTNQRMAQLNRRRSADWHGPLDMAIPVDKILFTESVGKDSQVAKAIAQIQAPPPSATSSPSGSAGGTTPPPTGK